MSALGQHSENYLLRQAVITQEGGNWNPYCEKSLGLGALGL